MEDEDAPQLGATGSGVSLMTATSAVAAVVAGNSNAARNSVQEDAGPEEAERGIEGTEDAGRQPNAGEEGDDKETAEEAMAPGDQAEEQALSPGLHADDLSLAPPAVITVQFRWAAQTFHRSDAVNCNRHVYRSRGALDGKGGLVLQYNDSVEHGKCWELGSLSGGVLYRLPSEATSPAGFIGNLPWNRTGGGTCYVTVMRKNMAATAADAAIDEVVGWVEPRLLAAESLW